MESLLKSRLQKELLLQIKAGNVQQCERILKEIPTADYIDCIDGSVIEESPLTLAIRLERLEICEMLLDTGKVNPNHSRCSWYPIELAAFFGLKDIASLLISRGADLKLCFPLEFVHTPEMAMFFLENGAFVNRPGESNEPCLDSPLHSAATNSEEEVCSFLVEHGADIHRIDLNYRTPLHLAARSGSAFICKLLLDRGANVDAEDLEGLTPLYLASIPEVCEVLVSHGSNVQHKTRRGWTPFHESASRGHVSVVAWWASTSLTLPVPISKHGLLGVKRMHPAVETFLGESPIGRRIAKRVCVRV